MAASQLEDLPEAPDAAPDEGVAPEFARFVAAQYRAAGSSAPAARAVAGQSGRPIRVDPKSAVPLLRVAARRASGFVRPGSGEQHAQVLWVDGENELAVQIAGLGIRFGEGAVTVRIPVRCDQTGNAVVEVLLATGTAARPAGLYAAAQRRPRGPEIVVTTWGDSLVAFAWESLLGMVAGLAAAAGKDTRGNVLVPAEMVASANGLVLMPMARHRFAGGSGLKPAAPAPAAVQPRRARREAP